MAVAGGLKVVKVARRAAPVAIEAYRRWNQLTPAERERYKKQARAAAARGQAIGREAYARAVALQDKQLRRKNR